MAKKEQKTTFRREEAAPTQQFIEIDRVKNGILILKGGGLRQILAVSGINFDLKSEEEQAMIISLFQNFLNSLDFAIQIFIHSRKLNIDSYLEMLSGREAQESNELLKNQISEYREFIRVFVQENAIMNKTYFVVVPYDPIQLPKKGEGAAKKLFGFLKKKGVERPTKRISEEEQNPEKELEHHQEQLNRRVDRIISGLNQINLRAVPLNDDELIELFYNLYNPQTVEKRGLNLSSAESQ